MLKKTLLFLTGFGLMVIGFTYIIIYFTLFNIGYSLYDYFLFIIRRIECLFVLLGFFLILFSMGKGDESK